MTWARLMPRVFAFEIRSCPSCASEMPRVELANRPEAFAEMLGSVGFAPLTFGQNVAKR